MALLDNIVSYWKLDESSGNATDSVGVNTLTNDNSTVFTAGKINNAGDFERGSANTFSIADGSQVGLDILSDMSVSLWVKIESALSGVGDKRTFLSKWDNVGNQKAYQFYYYKPSGTNQIFVEISNDGTAQGGGTVNVDLGTGTFKHIVITWLASTSTANVYMDGALIGSITTTGVTSIFNSTATFNIGETSGEVDTYFDGVMDEIGIWARELTAGEVSTLYNGGAGNQYPFSETNSNAMFMGAEF